MEIFKLFDKEMDLILGETQVWIASQPILQLPHRDHDVRRLTVACKRDTTSFFTANVASRFLMASL